MRTTKQISEKLKSIILKTERLGGLIDEGKANEPFILANGELSKANWTNRHALISCLGIKSALEWVLNKH